MLQVGSRNGLPKLHGDRGSSRPKGHRGLRNGPPHSKRTRNGRLTPKHTLGIGLRVLEAEAGNLIHLLDLFNVQLPTIGGLQDQDDEADAVGRLGRGGQGRPTGVIMWRTIDAL